MTAAPLPRSARVAGSTPARLDAEWARLCRDPLVAARLARRPLVGCTDLPALLAAAGGDPRRPVDPDAADAVVASLVRAAVGGDGLAARVVLQRLLAGIVSVATRRTRSHPWDLQALLDDLVATAWETIVAYPIERRPRRVVGNLCRDVEYRCCVAPARRLGSRVIEPLVADREPVVGVDGRATVHPTDELVGLLAEVGVERLGDDQRRLLGEILGGDRLDVVAARLQCTDRTVRNRRDRLVAELRRLAAA